MTKLERILLARASGRVQRFHCRALIRPENVAEHTFNLVNLLMVIGGRELHPRLLMAAFLHDMGEYATGDIPSPVKKALGKEAQTILEFKEAQHVDIIHDGVFNTLLTNGEEKLLQLADNLDGMLKATEEYRMGNYEVRTMALRYMEYVMELMGEVKDYDLETVGELVAYTRSHCYEN